MFLYFNAIITNRNDSCFQQMQMHVYCPLQILDDSILIPGGGSPIYWMVLGCAGV